MKEKNKKHSRYLLINILLFSLFAFNICSAKVSDQLILDTDNQSQAFQVESGYAPTTSVGSIMAAVIKGFLGLLGIIFVILIITAGYNWMTAAGEEEKVNKAKDTLKRAIIGLIIVVSAYAITYFVFTNLPGGSTTGPTTTVPPQ